MTIAHRICKHGIVEHPYAPDSCAHVVVTTMDGHRIAMHPIYAFDRAIQEAIRCADYPRNWTAQVELHCWTLSEVCQALRIDPKSLNISRDEVIATLKTALREGDWLDRHVATEQLTKLGELR